MLFNSYEFLFVFLPIVLLLYYLFISLRQDKATIFWLALASIAFYAWWRYEYVLLLLASICFNYWISLNIIKAHRNNNPAFAKLYLVAGIGADLLLLGYYKYAHFILDTINPLFGLSLSVQETILPLGISFFTFTQIAYLVDAYKKLATEYDFIKYTLFVTYFPHLIAGPILHHKDMIPQFDIRKLKNISFQSIYVGILIFVIGLFKKVIIADTLAVFANTGFDITPKLYLLEGWITSLAYTFQLYFDFSGYSDMAVGLGLIMQIRLPINFNCPYMALTIQDFWRRWHITLSTFLRDYVYIPLGGNQGSKWTMYKNLFLTFLIGGIWHGAGWLFIIWGALHGVAVIIHKKCHELKFTIPTVLCWLMTFLFVNMAWVFFRAKNLHDAFKVLKAMVGKYGLCPPSIDIFSVTMLLDSFKFNTEGVIPFLNSDLYAIFVCLVVFLLAVILTVKNAHDIVRDIKPNWVITLLFSLGTFLILLKINKTTEFLYFNF